MKLVRKVTKRGYTYDPRVDGVSQSMLNAWLQCRQIANLGIIHGWESVYSSKPLIYGSIGHGVLMYANRRFQQGVKVPKAAAVSKAALKDDLKAAYADWKAERHNTTASLDIAAESCAQLEATLPVYYDRWAEDDAKREWTIVEESFKVPMKMPDGQTVLYVGKFDGVYKCGSNTRLFETKFKGFMPENLVDVLALDLQLCAYLTALEILGNKRPNHVLYNILRRPGERRKKTENLVDFVDRIRVNAIAESSKYFVRLECALTSQEVDRAHFKMQKLVEEFYHWWKTQDHSIIDPLWNSAQCDGKYGACHFLPCCSRDDYASHRIREKAHPEL
jgi:hypothetical protein